MAERTLEEILINLRQRVALLERRRPVGGGRSFGSPVTQGTTAPTSIPRRIGAMYVRTDNKKVYIATGTVSAADWTLMN